MAALVSVHNPTIIFFFLLTNQANKTFAGLDNNADSNLSNLDDELGLSSNYNASSGLGNEAGAGNFAREDQPRGKKRHWKKRTRQPQKNIWIDKSSFLLSYGTKKDIKIA